MKKGLKYLFLVVALLFCYASWGRDIYSLNRRWTFSIGHTNSTSHGKEVNLPHTWNNDAMMGKTDYYVVVGFAHHCIVVPSVREIYLFAVRGAVCMPD